MNYPLIILCSSISTLLPFLSSTIFFKHLNKQSRSLISLWIFFALSVVSEIVLFVLNSQHKQSAWIFHIYTVLEYVLITIILANWQSKPATARLMRISIPIYVFSFVLIKAVGLETFEAGLHNTVTRPLAIFIMCICASITLHDLWRRSPEDITDDYRFWMLLAMASYYSASLVLFAFMFTKDRDLLVALFEIHAVVHITHNVLFTIGIFKVRCQGQAAVQPISASDQLEQSQKDN